MVTIPRHPADVAPAGGPIAYVDDRVAAAMEESVRLAHAHLECAPLPSAVVSGAAHVLVFANAAFRQLSEAAAARADIGVPIVDALPSAEHEGLNGLLDRVRCDGVAVQDAHLGFPPMGESPARRATWSCDVWPVVEGAGRLDYLVVTVRATRRGEDARSRQRAITERLLFAALREQDVAQGADRARARAVFLAEESRRLGVSFDLEAVYAAIATVALPKVGAWSIVDVDRPDASWWRLPIVHPDPMKRAIVQDLDERWSPAPGDPLGVSLIAETRASTIVDTDVDAALAGAAHGPDNLRLLRELGLGALLVVPLIIHKRLRGAITFVNPIGAAPYTVDDVQLAEDLASRCADLLDGARRYDGARLAQISADAARARSDTARRDAEHANLVKTSFLTSMSHELRTPLNAILGYTELVAIGLRGPVTVEQLDALGRIRTASKHLLGLINNVLNFARLKSREVPFVNVDSPVSEVLDGAALMVEPQASAKGIAFVRTPCLPTLVVHGDVEKVLQILLNLLSNAIKFTDAGGSVTLAAVRSDRRRRVSDATSISRSGTAAAVDLTVRDTGRGIAAEHLKTLFDPFVQVGRRLSGTDEGTGLGLAISRDLARAMGGNVTVVSTLGVGSTFTLTMPCAGPG